jgi:hypothetical protein
MIHTVQVWPTRVRPVQAAPNFHSMEEQICEWQSYFSVVWHHSRAYLDGSSWIVDVGALQPR